MMSASMHRPSMGLLHLQEGEKNFQLTRYAPSEDIAFFVKHFWIVSWDLSEQKQYLQEVVPNPCVNLVIQQGRSGIFGAAKQKYSYLVEGKGCVFGAKFRPGGFYPFMQQPVSSLADRPLDIREIFDVDGPAMEELLLSQEGEAAMVELAERFIKPKLPVQDESVTLINQMVDWIMSQRDVTKVDQLCAAFHINKRTLQRLFDQYVGVSPKWVIQLYRLQNAAETLDRSPSHDWTQLALELGYHDQSHFIKDFKAVIGVTPEQYASGSNRKSNA
ncbi:helix-turn-helix domain-containing protein [Paenibacillus sp. FSL H8-0537]|uniref:AraC family transcriptional regulator n=1 Tax=Paenibacillus sp. FSL H8-0537 TaxID=2921399 RepID=UPI00310194C9